MSETVLTRIGIILGSTTMGFTMADIDLILAIILKGVSIVSFLIVIVINFPKFYKKMKEFFNEKNK